MRDLSPSGVIKPEVRGLTAYTLKHFDAEVKLDQNENPYELPADLKREIVERVLHRPWGRYPEFVPASVVKSLAMFTGWPGLMSAVSPDFKSKIGASTQPPFSTGTGAAKNSGVAASVQSTDGAIGYVAISYIAADSLNEALIQNAAGKYPTPSVDSIKAAADAVSSAQPDGSIPLVNPPASAATAYPLSTYTYAIVPQKSSKASQLKAFLTYAITDGQAFGPDLGFPPLPSAVVASDKTEIAKIS